MEVGSERITLKFASNQCNQTISVVVDVIIQFSSSIEERETIYYFLLFQAIRVSKKDTKLCGRLKI